MRIATNRVWNNRATGEKQEQVEFHTVVAWGNLADICSKYLRKGQLALFEGRLQTRSWQGSDGVKRYRTEIVAENMQLGPKAMNTGSSYSQQINPVRSSPPRGPSGASSPLETSSLTGRGAGETSNGIKEEDIPVIDENTPVTSDPIITENDIEEKEIDLKDIPF